MFESLCPFQIVLGQLYYQGGRGVEVNHEMALHYFVTAAESGNANAYAYLGKVRQGPVGGDGGGGPVQNTITSEHFYNQ